MSQKYIEENKILLRKGDKNYILTFELQNEGETMVIKAEEEKKNEKLEISYSYRKVLTVKEFAQKKREIQIKSMKIVLKKIISSSESNRLEFEIEDKKHIKLFYYFLDGEKEEINVPVAYKAEDPQTFLKLSSIVSHNSKQLKQILKYINALKININHANAFNIKLKNKENFHRNLFKNQKHEIKNIILDLKNFILGLNEQQSEKISSNRKSFEDNVNIKSELNQIVTQATSIQNALKQQNDQITNQRADINNNLKPEISSVKNAIQQKSEEHSKKISDLNSELNSKLNTHTSSINNLFKQQAEENTKQFSDLNSKLTTQTSQIKDLNNKISSIEDIIHQGSEENIKKISELKSDLNVQSVSIKNIQRKNEQITEQISGLNAKIDTQTSSIQDIPQTFRRQKEETDKQISEINKKLTDQKKSIENIPKFIQFQSSENDKQISNLNNKLDAKLNAQTSSIQKSPKQQNEESTKISREEKLNAVYVPKTEQTQSKKNSINISKDLWNINFALF